ncbi:conjugal transfer protein [Weissella confusa]|uniref:conjugal transfer protein n=1 Tax=Weissella confusa TaxID=1583 RepID=UPI001C6F6AB1|nr:conjugal transfer protein [Weissella confusa]QYU56839.1 conjugal transfer protein [Weissella confusa]
MARKDGTIANVQAWEALGYDFETILDTQPQVPVEIFPTYAKVPGGYQRVLYVHDLDNDNYANHFLRKLSEEHNVILDIDTGVEMTGPFKDKLDKAYVNKITDGRDGGIPKLSKQFDTSDSAYAMMMYNMLKNNAKAMRLYIRLFVFARTKRALEQRTRELIAKYPRFKFAVLRGFQTDEYRSQWLPALLQSEKLDESQPGLSISSLDLGGAYWANQTKLEDPYGSIIGSTFTGGMMNFNLYTRDGKSRVTPFALIAGDPSYGKSTLQKLLVEDAIKRGHRVAMFDPSKEYHSLTKSAGGVIYSLNGDGMTINPFQVFVTETLENGEVDYVNSFAQHIEKLLAIYGFMSQGLTQEQLSDDRISLKILLTKFYIDQGLWTDAPQLNPGIVKSLFERQPREFPKLSHFNVWLNSAARMNSDGMYGEKLPVTQRSLMRLQATFSNMEKQYGNIFNAYTTAPDLSQEDVVCYDVSGILQSKDLFNAQVYSVLAMENHYIIRNGRQQRQLRRENKIALDEVKHTVLVLDEAQNYISLDNAYNLKFIVTVLEQMRKNFAALMMAMPTIKDVVLIDKSSPDVAMKEFTKNVDKLFGLMQYRFFFHLPDSDATALKIVLGNSITVTELAQVPKLQKRQALLNIQNYRNYLFSVTVTNDELRRFDGGE